ncbi:cupin domain-containing protein [Lewinella sp. W8]|uniref:cupin domain-containing protein n=1 Tax=Lewinella sp. W8 TaxID=2528208 RepID=UPI0010683F8A|nr:hypothetical protein [Lewinella sp. W8]MTB53051.1 hypothetical protein [Lewinella sp. W8]
MNSYIYSITFQIIGYVTLGLTFYLLAVALKNDRLKMDHPVLSRRTTKLALVGVFVSLFGYLAVPGENQIWWALFNASIMGALGTFAYYYKEQYERIKIAYVDHSAYLTIPTENYIEAEPGVWLRVLTPKSKILTPEEVDLLKIMEDYPADNWLGIAFEISDGSNFPPHIHPKWEHTYLTKGEAEVFDNYRKLEPGKHIEVPPITKHHFKALAKCRGISFIQK